MKRFNAVTLFFVLTAVLSVIGPARGDAGFQDLYSKEGVLIQARVIKIEGGKVYLVRKKDGRRFTVPVERFDETTRKSLERGNALPADEASPPKNKKFYPRTKNEIRKAFLTIESAAEEQTKFSKEEQEACGMLNIYRYLCFLPYKVKLDRKMCEGAVIAAKGFESWSGDRKNPSSTPHDVNPEAKMCCLSAVGALPESIRNYIVDSGDRNRHDRGHRGACLNPRLGKIGLGRSAEFCAMWSTDKSGKAPRYRDGFFAYPSPGYFPVEFLEPDTAWTVYFPGKGLPDKEDVELKVYRLSTMLEKTPRHGEAPPESTELEVGYLSVAEGLIPCVNFEPNIVPEAGDIYWVSVKARSLKVAYLVEFFDSEG